MIAVLCILLILCDIQPIICYRYRTAFKRRRAVPVLFMGLGDLLKNALANDPSLSPAQNPGLNKPVEPVEVEFQPAGKTVKAYLGQNIGMIAQAARVEIRYKCREGDCGTCTVKVNGKNVKACVSSLPSVSTVKKFFVEVPKGGKPAT